MPVLNKKALGMKRTKQSLLRHHIRYRVSVACYRSAKGPHSLPTQLTRCSHPHLEPRCLVVCVYDRDKVQVDELCPFMHSAQEIAEATTASMQQKNLTCSHALYVAAILIYTMSPLEYLARNGVASMSVC